MSACQLVCVNFNRIDSILMLNSGLVVYYGSQELVQHLIDERDNARLLSHDAFVMVIMTHGNSGCVFTADGERLNIDDITTMFDGHHCKALLGKPKMFFIQACQGGM